MAYRANPFLERMSERTTSDQEFVRLFSPKILERLPEDVFEGAVHIFRSSPGGGKTTLLRAFTPTALKAFWNARRSPEIGESYQRLAARGVLHDQDGPQVLGVFLSCASGYADLPPGASTARESLFRALLDCRVVLRSLRSLASLLGFDPTAPEFSSMTVGYRDSARDLQHIPLSSSPGELIRWAEQREREVYAQLDSVAEIPQPDVPAHFRFESVLWLQSVEFIKEGRSLPLRPLLMIDDLHKLRRRQRGMLLTEVAELRPTIPVWLAERTIVLGDELLSQGVREGRDIREYPLEEIWSTGRQQQFASFAQNVLDRRLELQDLIPAGAFSQYLRGHFQTDEAREPIGEGLAKLARELDRFQNHVRYREWISLAQNRQGEVSLEALRDLYATRILIARDQAKKQLTLELGSLTAEDLEDRDNSQVQGAADIFIHEDLGVPYYFGIERVCAMATSNVDELLALAAALYEGLLAKQVLRKPDLQLSPAEQEKRLTGAARRRRDFIPKNHTEGTRAQRLLDAIGSYCRDRTFLPNAPYAPGVTGVRLSQSELARLTVAQGAGAEHRASLKRVLAECVAENLLVARASAASTSRDSGTIFYLNRTLCSFYGLPLQMGGWQDITLEEVIDWMELGRAEHRNQRLEIH